MGCKELVIIKTTVSCQTRWSGYLDFQIRNLISGVREAKNTTSLADYPSDSDISNILGKVGIKAIIVVG